MLSLLIMISDNGWEFIIQLVLSPLQLAIILATAITYRTVFTSLCFHLSLLKWQVFPQINRQQWYAAPEIVYSAPTIASKLIAPSNFQVVGIIRAFTTGLFDNMYFEVTGNGHPNLVMGHCITCIRFCLHSRRIFLGSEDEQAPPPGNVIEMVVASLVFFQGTLSLS